MGRKDKWKQVWGSMNSRDGQKDQTVEEREKMPEKGCGYCKNFLENAYTHDGRGSCCVLKTGSNLKSDPPILITEGDTGFVAHFNTDGAGCPHFLKMAFIDKDLGETSDPYYRRAHRQMEDT